MTIRKEHAEWGYRLLVVVLIPLCAWGANAVRRADKAEIAIERKDANDAIRHEFNAAVSSRVSRDEFREWERKHADWAKSVIDGMELRIRNVENNSALLLDIRDSVTKIETQLAPIARDFEKRRSSQ